MPKRKFLTAGLLERRQWKIGKKPPSGKRTNASNRAASEIIMPVDGSHFNDDTCDEELDTAPAITLLRSSFGKATDAALESASTVMDSKVDAYGKPDMTQTPDSKLDNKTTHLTISMTTEKAHVEVPNKTVEVECECSGDVESEDEDSHVSPESLDPFVSHFERVLPEKSVENGMLRTEFMEENITYPHSGSFTTTHPKELKSTVFCTSLEKSHIQASLLRNLKSLENYWSETSEELFGMLNNYIDVFDCQKDYKHDLLVKRAYCLHVLNHVLKTRKRIVTHNSKITKKTKDVLDFRDQGFTRPKVLILVPFRHNGYRIFEILCQLLSAKSDVQIMNRKRFIDEFGWENKDPVAVSDRPEDFRANFLGNTDDCFRIGIAVAKKTLKLYTDFYAADILIASPLGLRMIIGSEGEKKYEYDFLSSIEILILDHTDVFLMQNWEHVSHIMKHLHRQPTATRDVDLSRVRTWTLNGWSALYRQSIIFAAQQSPELSALINRQCLNYAGKAVRKIVLESSLLSGVVVRMPHAFHKIPGQDFQKISDARFRFFCEKTLPRLLDSTKSHTMIFVPSYFDFVRLRNHFKREEISFVQICEYSSSAKVTRARDLFFHGKKQFLLYTERFHFFRRYRIRGICHLVFYELPRYPSFYSEMCNMMVEEDGVSIHQLATDVLYSRFDALKLAPIVGMFRTNSLIHLDKPVHTFATTPADK